jgi:hypothetical protein
MINTTTGDFRLLTSDEALMTAGDPVEVLVHGTEDQIARLSAGIKTLNADEKRKARRKAQRRARKRNR